MVPSKLAKALAYAIKHKRPMMITGSPGIGKSDIVFQACLTINEEMKDKARSVWKAKDHKKGEKFDEDKKYIDLIISHPIVSDPTDYKGLPFPNKDGKTADFLPFGDLMSLINADKPTVFFLDDLGQAPASVQASCFIPGTLILGESYRDIKDIKEGELVIGDDGCSHRVTHKFEHNYTGKLYKISSVNRVPITCTEEHPFEVIETYKRGNVEHGKIEVVSSPVWKTAKELVKGEYVGTPIIKPYIDDDEIYVDTVGSFKRTVKFSNDFARFLGYYVGNGYCINHPSVSRVNVCFNLAHKDKIDDCRKIMGEIFGKHVFEKIDHNCIYLGIHDKYLKHFFHKHCGDDVYDKKIPEFILYHKNIEYLTEFLRGYFLTDGYLMADKGKNRGIAYSTVSKKLALQTQIAFTRLGTIPGIKIKQGGESEFPGGRICVCRKSYTIQVSDSEALVKIGVEKDELRIVRYSFIHNNKLWTRITDIAVSNYDGKVYNLEVEGVNTYVANNYIVHNCMQLLLARRINTHKVSDHVTFIAATNRREDRAGVQGILEPVKSRFYSILPLEVEVDDWIFWAIKHKMPTDLISFVRFRREILTDFKPTSNIVNVPCPRTIANVGYMLNDGMPRDCESELISGAAGEGFSAEFVAFREVYKSLPTYKSILSNPSGARLPTEVNQLYAVCGLISSKADRKTFPKIIKYITRMDEEFQVMVVKDCIAYSKAINNLAVYSKWIEDHLDVIVRED